MALCLARWPVGALVVATLIGCIRAAPGKLRLAASPSAADKCSGRTLLSEGCCYSIGYGSMMVPCCLSHEDKGQSACLDEVEEGTVGGAVGWSPCCPEDAGEGDSEASVSLGRRGPPGARAPRPARRSL